MTDLKSLTLPEMTAFLQSLGEPAFRGRQVFTWLHRGVKIGRASCRERV